MKRQVREERIRAVQGSAVLRLGKKAKGGKSWRNEGRKTDKKKGG